MEVHNQLGIYLRGNHATVVCLAPGKERRVLHAFSVSVEEQGEQTQQFLAELIAEACRRRKVRFAEAGVALDCASFMQHAVHSEFRDAKKIGATIRFDTEEALAADVSDVAVAFRTASDGAEGANLEVFTAQRSVLSDIILSLQSQGIDPVSIDPDVYCLSRYLLEYGKADGAAPQSTLYALLSDCRAYLVAVSGAREACLLRTSLIGPAQDRNALLVREALVTAGLAEPAGAVGRLRVFDARGEAAAAALKTKMGLPAELCSLPALAGVTPDGIADCANPVDFALACGAALTLADTVDTVNLRNDHMPYLGRKRRIQKAVRLLSIGLTVLLLSLGVGVHSQLLQVNGERTALRAKFEADYLTVILGQKKLPATMQKAVDNLEKALRQIRAEKQGIGANQASISAKLTLVLKALYACAAQTGLTVDSITVTATSVLVNGSTSSRQNTVSVLPEAMKKAGLLVKQDNVKADGTKTESGRDSFSIVVEPMKAPQGT